MASEEQQRRPPGDSATVRSKQLSPPSGSNVAGGELAAAGPRSRLASSLVPVWHALRWTRTTALLLRPPVVLLLLATLIISRGITEGEFHFYVDETRHGFNGVFFRDFLADLPLRHPVQYTYEYYAKYPAIAIPHWPPFFYLIEGFFFLVLGISVWVSRLAILGFALVGIYSWYRIAERQGPWFRAFLSALIFACLPYVLKYEHVTMLEIPGVALCLASIYFWLRFLEQERSSDLWAVAGFAAAAFLTSQSAIFLLFFLALHFLLGRRFHLLKRWQVWAALATTVVLVVPWYMLSMNTLAAFSGRAVASGLHHFAKTGVWSFYLQKLPEQMGWFMLSLGVAGCVFSLIRAPRRYRFLLLWIVSCYLCFVLIPEKDARHTMIWIPPFLYFALVAVEILCVKKHWGQVCGAALGLFFLVQAFRFEPPRLKGMEPVVRYVLAQPETDIVYYQGELNGDFIFFVRKFDPEKRRMVARDKQVVVTQIVYDQRQVLHTPEEILNFFRTWGIRYAVVEDHYDTHGLKVVNAVLDSGAFEVVRRFRLSSNNPKLDNRQVSVYRYCGEIQRSREPVVVPMMTIRNNIHADLSRLAGRPWPD